MKLHYHFVEQLFGNNSHKYNVVIIMNMQNIKDISTLPMQKPIYQMWDFIFFSCSLLSNTQRRTICTLFNINGFSFVVSFFIINNFIVIINMTHVNMNHIIKVIL